MEALGTLEELASSGHIDDLLCKANVDEDEPASTNQVIFLVIIIQKGNV